MSADEVKKRKALAPADSGMDYSSNDEDDDEDDCSDDDDMDLDDDDDDKGALEELRALPGALYAHARAAMAKLSRPNEHGFHSGVSLTAYRASLMSIKDALEKSRSVIFEAVEPSLKDMHEKYLKRANRDDGKVPPGSAAVERRLGDNKCMLCLLCTELAAVHDMLGEEGEGVMRLLREALMWFPRSVQANVLLAKFSRPLADSEEKMAKIDELLRKAVACGNLIDKTKISVGADDKCDVGDEGYDEAAMDNELLLQEMSALSTARQMLALLYCQSGRCADAKKHLVSEGFRWRLSAPVLNYCCTAAAPLPEASSSAAAAANDSSCDAFVGGRRAAAAVDGALPPLLLQHMQQVFAAPSPFWSEHCYDVLANSSRTAGYFSYLYPFRERAAKSSIEQVIDHLYSTVVTSLFPEAARDCTVAEWWVHTRPHSSGHQLHFDSDETRTQSTGDAAHPLVSLVLYVGENADMVGGPTLITDQTLQSQRLAEKGWLCFPKTNRALAFDAKYLHGVVPGKGACADVNGRRLSFMVGFWASIQSTQRAGGLPGPGQLFPAVEAHDPLRPNASANLRWPALMPVQPECVVDPCSCAASAPALLVPVNEVWEAVDRGSVASAIMRSKVKLPHIDQLFQF